MQEPIGKRVKPLISNSSSNTFPKPKQASFSLLTFYLQSHPKSKQISQYFYQYSKFNHYTEKSLIFFYRIKKDSNEFYGTGLARFLFRSNKLFYIVKFSQVRWIFFRMFVTRFKKITILGRGLLWNAGQTEKGNFGYDYC